MQIKTQILLDKKQLMTPKFAATKVEQRQFETING